MFYPLSTQSFTKHSQQPGPGLRPTALGRRRRAPPRAAAGAQTGPAGRVAARSAARGRRPPAGARSLEQRLGGWV